MILIFGATGQVGQALAQCLRPGQGLCLDRTAADFAKPGAVTRAVVRHKPDVVINATAFTAVDRAEEAPDQAFAVNAQGVGELAQACAAAGVPLIHISTDYVFAGTGDQPWAPDAPALPVNIYGQSKAAGEAKLRAAGGVYVILRTSWVISGAGQNFLTTMLRLGQSRDSLQVVADQWGGPTPAADIAQACLSIADQLLCDPTKSGTYHFAGHPAVNWAGFARAIFQAAKQPVTVQEIATADYPTPAQRPLNSRLDCTTTQTTFGLPCPDWQGALPGMVGGAERGGC